MATPSFDEFYKLAKQIPENRFVTSDKIRALYDSKYAELYEAEQRGDTSAGLAGGWENVKGMANYAGAALADVAGFDGVQQGLVEDAQENERKAGLYSTGRVAKVEDINGIGDLVDFAQYQFGNLLPTIGESVIGAGIGAAASGGANPVGALTGAVARGAVKDVVKDLATRGLTRGLSKQAAEKIARERVSQVINGELKDEAIEGIIAGRARSLGAQLGAAATGYQMGTGDLYGTSVEAGDPSPYAALAGAVPYAAADLLTGKIIADPVFRGVKEGSSKLGNASKIGAASTLAEGTAELTQEELNIQLQAALDPSFDPTGEDANSRRLNAFVIGGLAGGAGGILAGAGAKPIEVRQAETLDDALVQQAKRDVEQGIFTSIGDVEKNLDLKIRAKKATESFAEEQLAQQKLADEIRKINAANRAEKKAKENFKSGDGLRNRVRQLRENVESKSDVLAYRGEVVDDPIAPESRRIGQKSDVIEGQFENTLTLPIGDIVKKNGQPYPSSKSAETALKSRKDLKDKRLVVTETEDGWVLRDVRNLNQKALPEPGLSTPMSRDTVSVGSQGTAFTDTQLREEALRRRNDGLTPDVRRAQDAMANSEQTPVETQQPAAIDPEPVNQPEPDGTEDTPSANPNRAERGWYKNQLEGLADRLVKGGGISYVYDNNDKIVGRTSTENPEWFGELNNFLESDGMSKTSVKDVKNIVSKVNSGKKIVGKKQHAIVDYMLDLAEEQGAGSPAELQRAIDDYDRFQAGTPEPAEIDAVVPEAQPESEPRAEAATGTDVPPVQRQADNQSDGTRDSAEDPEAQEQVGDDPFGMGGTRVEGDDPFALDAPTEDGLKKADQEESDAKAAKAEQDRAAKEREQADRDRDDFDLTGSTAPADANPRQGDLVMEARRAERQEAKSKKVSTAERLESARETLSKVLGESPDINDLSGKFNTGTRQTVMSVLTGQSVPKSQAGIGALKNQLVEMLGIEDGTLASMNDAINNWIRGEQQSNPEVKAVTLNNTDQFDDFIASAEPGVEYAITWPDGKTTKIRDIENSIPRLELIAKNVLRDESLRMQGERVRVSQEDVDADRTVAVDETLDEEVDVIEEPMIRPVDGFVTMPTNKLGDPEPEVSGKIEAGIEGKTAIEAVEWLANNAPTTSYQVIADRVVMRMKQMMKAGSVFDFKVNHLGDSVPASLTNARGYTSMRRGSNVITVRVNGADVVGKVGASYETLLHEMLHAVTKSALFNGNRKSMPDGDLKQTVAEFIELTNFVIDNFNKKASKDKKSLNEFEQKFLKRMTNSMKDPDELLAWGMTNREAQQYFDSIPYKNKQSVWGKFVSLIRHMLGLDAKSESVLSEILRLTDKLLDSDVDPTVTFGSPQGNPNGATGEANVSAQMSMGGVLSPESRVQINERTEQARNDVARWFKRYFKLGGNSNKLTVDSKILADAEKNAGQKELEGAVIDFKRAAMAAFGTKDFYKIPENQREMMNEYLVAEPDDKAAIASTLNNDRLVAKLDDMRSYLDMWSGNLQNALFEQFETAIATRPESQQRKWREEGIPPADLTGALELIQLIEQNKGRYLNRSYRIFDEGRDYMREILKDTSLIAQAKEEVRQNNLWSVASDPTIIGTRAANREAKVQAAVDYLDAGIGSDLLTDKQIDKLDLAIADERLLTESQLQGAVEAILLKAAEQGDLSSLISSGNLYGSKDVSILKRRKELSPVMLQLLGEYKDPGINFVTSATKMQSYVANHNFLMKLYEGGKGVFMFDKADSDGTGRFIKPLNQSTAFQNPLNPLNRMNVEEDFYTALEDLNSNFDSSGLMNTIIRWNSVVKYGKTVLSPTTQARNFLAGPMFIFNMGHNPFSKGFIDTARVAWDDLIKNQTNFNAYTAKLVKLGVLHDNANSTEMRKTLEDFDDNLTDLVVDTRGFSGKMKAINQKFQRAYQWGDDFWKMMAFEKEKKDWMDNGLSLVEAEKRAADRVRNGMPTYSMVPRAFQLLRRTPFVGSFVAFPYEVFRTTANNIRFIKEDINAGRNAMAYKRMAGMVVSSSATYALSIATMQMLGISGEDDEALKMLGPHWSKNSLFIYTGYDEETATPTFIDSAYTDPYSIFKKTLNAITSDNNMDVKEKVVDAMKEVLSPFLGTDIVAGALGEVIFNQKETGGAVYNEQDSAAGQLSSMVNHMRKALQPGVAANTERLGKSLFGIKTATGKEYDLQDELIALLGVRAITLDAGQALTYKGYGLKDELRDAQSLLSRAAADRNGMSKDELQAVFETSMASREKTYARAMKMIRGMRSIGKSNAEIVEALRASNFSKKDIGRLLNGIAPRWEMSSRFIDTARKRVMASSVSEKEKIETIKMFNERKRWINEFASQQ